MPSECSVECRNLSKVFGKRVVLREVDLKARPGTIVSLMGVNGSGKTTLLKILATLIVPSSGEAMICGRDVARHSHQVRMHLGFVPSEERSFYWRLTARQNLRFFAALYGLHGRNGSRRVEHLLQAVGLDQSGDVCFREYSTGMKQALAIARGMLHDPSVLLLDEPTRSLSPNVAKKVCNLLRATARDEGKTILIASHNLVEVEKLADQITVIQKGRIRACGTQAEIKATAGLREDDSLETVFEYYTCQDETR